MPPAAPALLTHLAVAADDVLVGRQLAQADRAARVQLLGRVADLGAHAELEAVGEAGRGVGVDDGGVDPGGEALGGLLGGGDDRLRVAGAVAVDVLDRLLERVDDADGQLQVEVLGVPVLLARPAPTSTPPAAARARSSPTSSTPASRRSASDAGQELRGDRGVDEQRLGRVADAGPLRPSR